MRRAVVVLAGLLVLCVGSAWAAPVPVETYTLPNGLTVILHEDHTLPQVRVNIWYRVGSRDEAPGRTGFAHLFEHLMFMGSTRVPGNSFDVLMESGGGANNASTSEDRTNYYSWGPSALLPTLLWLDADRMEGLGKAMTQAKVDLQCSVVRNERRQSYENAPYGQAQLAMAEALYPADHPYHHPVIGSHEDLQAATLQDVRDFFASYYVPANASLVVAGDFDPRVAKDLIAKTFGAVPPQPAPGRRSAAPVVLEREVRRLLTDAVDAPKLFLVWPAPAAFAPGSAELDLLTGILADGTSGRLHTRLVLTDRLAREVAVYLDSRDLVSELHVEVTAVPGGDLERIKRVVLEELARLRADGPTQAELDRVKAATEASFLRRREDLGRRADMLNQMWTVYGEADSFDRELARRMAPTAGEVRDAARRTLGEGRLDLRVLPKDASVASASLDARPADLADAPGRVPVPERLTLSNGVPLLVVSRPGSGLFAGCVVVDGGERLVPAEEAGLATLVATMLGKGAGSRDAEAFAAAVSALGARFDATASWHDTTVWVSGLTSRLEETLDLFADAVLRPRLAAADAARERDLQLAGLRARVEVPAAVAHQVAGILLFGRDDPRGRPQGGYEATVATLTEADVAALAPRLLDPRRATFVFAGDVVPRELAKALEARFSKWKGEGATASELPGPRTGVEKGELVLVHRQGAPQSYLLVARPLPGDDERTRALRNGLDTLLGGTFTSRLMQNIREKHGYSYGARSEIDREANQLVMTAHSSVQTAVTAAALGEFRNEYQALANGTVTEAEWGKATRTVRFDMETAAATTAGLAQAVAETVRNGLPADSLDRELAALAATTAAAANTEARQGMYLWPAQLVVIVGDRDQVVPQLEKAGFGKPREVDLEGRPVAR